MRPPVALLIFIFVLATILTAGCITTPSQNQSGATPTITQPPPYGAPSSPEALVAFVEKAYEYAQVHGKDAALAEFNNQTGLFVEGDLYIFAYDLDGNTLALPFQPDLLGKSRWNASDANGTPFIQQIIHTAQSGGGFVHYLYLDPADNNTVKPKISYVMSVDQDWVIGSGIYNAEEVDPLIRVGGDPQVRVDLKSYVEEAISYAREQGRDAAIAEFNDRNGTFVRGNLYIYAFDYNGTTLALPFQPRLIGTDLSGLQDPFGVNYTKVEIYLAQQGGGFIFYHYPNPARNMTLEPKMSYVAPVDETWWLGVGIYLYDVPRTISFADLAIFVENASVYAAAVGEKAALAEFQQKDGPFSQENLYIYAYDHNGTLLAHPYQADLVGTNRLNWTDVRGLPMIRVGAYVASHGGGFISYLYPAPQGGVIDEKALDTYQPKIGYVFPVNERWWVGSGIYFSDIVPLGSRRPEVISQMIGLVEASAAYGREMGTAAAFAEISNRSGRFVDAKGHYIYAYDYNGTLLAHPYLPEKIGSSLINRTDPFGMKNIQALVDTAQAKGGYIVFIWPNPDKGNQEELKIGYV
ncbi:MAG: cache domain-containing protein, partial [Methanomicrobiales archaeon]|nr:cache domain-containing protein [Methanomicrobiales archaeon]